MKIYIFIIILGLSINSKFLNGSSLTNEQRLEILDRDIQEFQARIRALQDRYKYLEKKLEEPRHTDVHPDPHIETGSDDFQDQIILDKVNESSPDGVAVANEEIIYSEQNKNSFRFSYAICIPHDTGYGNYNLEYETGHSIGLNYNRDYESFFWGIKLGVKVFENKKMTNIPTWLPQNFQSILSNPKGNNYSTNLSLLAGIKHDLTEKLYLQGNLGVGISYSWDEIQLGSTTVEYNEANFYGACNLGVGLRFSELTSLLLFYQIDAHGDSGNLESRVFSQVGLNLGIHY